MNKENNKNTWKNTTRYRDNIMKDIIFSVLMRKGINFHGLLSLKNNDDDTLNDKSLNQPVR